MIDFRIPVLEDKERVDAFVRNCGQIGCDVSFANTYLWRERYGIQIAFDEDTYYKCYTENGRVTGYALPVTRGDLRSAVDKVIADARERGVTPLIGLLNNNYAEQVHRLYHTAVSIEENRDSFDYIYQRENLANLSGKKFHAKRNHISRFMREHDEYSVEELNEHNLQDALSVAEGWQRMNSADEDSGEMAAIRQALEHFDALGLFGLVLYVDQKPVAMCIASEINDRVCDVHFEKAVDIDEGFAVINHEFAAHFDQYTLVNREEDMGLEGLRKAKLSYHPDILYSKSFAVFR